MNYYQYRKWAYPFVEQFVDSLEGRYSQHVSNQFMIEYLANNLATKLVMCSPSESLQNRVYRTGCELFENLLEYGCRAGGNGHHVAQDFCNVFPDILVKDISNRENTKMGS